VEKHNILQLPNGREQIFYHLLPDTRDIDLSIPPSFAAATSSSFSSSRSPSIADCTPAFLCGSDQNDDNPFLMTGLISCLFCFCLIFVWLSDVLNEAVNRTLSSYV